MEDITKKEWSLGSLLRRAVELRTQLNGIRKELGQVQDMIASMATYGQGSKTCTMAEDGILCKVQRRETVTWDQRQLKMAYQMIGAEGFSQAFDYEFKPISAKALNAWMADPNTPDAWRKMISIARTVKTQAPSVTFEDVRGE